MWSSRTARHGCSVPTYRRLPTASTHVQPDPLRTRKLLLRREELNRLIGAVERSGYTLVPLAMYWKRGRVKLEIGLAKGKKRMTSAPWKRIATGSGRRSDIKVR